MSTKNCFFCENQTKHLIIAENDFFYSRYDDYPVTEGHAAIISKQHVESFFDLSEKEVVLMYQLIKETKKRILQRCHPDGFNVGVNEGRAAGRTIDHLHIHLIPRYDGDVANPRGGIRCVIPEKRDY